MKKILFILFTLSQIILAQRVDRLDYSNWLSSSSGLVAYSGTEITLPDVNVLGSLSVIVIESDTTKADTLIVNNKATFNSLIRQDYTETTATNNRPVTTDLNFIATPSSEPAINIDYHGFDLAMRLTDSGNNNTLIGMYPFESNVLFEGADSMGRGVAVYGLTESSGSGYMDQAMSYRAMTRNKGTGVIDEMFGLYISAPLNTMGGTVNKTYGIWIEEGTVGGTTNTGIVNLGTTYLAKELYLGYSGDLGDYILQATGNGFITGNWDVQGTLTFDSTVIDNIEVVTLGDTKAYTFDGTDDFGTVSDNDSLDFGSGSFSLEWTDTYPQTQSGSYAGIISKSFSSAAPAKGWGLAHQSTTTDDIRYYESSDGGGSYTTSKLLFSGVPNGYHHFVFIRDTTNNYLKLYVDGRQVYSTSYTADQDLNNSADLLIKSQASGNESSGEMSLVRVYRYALTASQVSDVYNNGAPELYKPDWVTASYRQENATTSTWYDDANGLDMTMTGSPTLLTENKFGDVNVQGELVLATETPASAAATGTAGEIRWDSNYIYICVATNTWKRVAISTW